MSIHIAVPRGIQPAIEDILGVDDKPFRLNERMKCLDDSGFYSGDPNEDLSQEQIEVVQEFMKIVRGLPAELLNAGYGEIVNETLVISHLPVGVLAYHMGDTDADDVVLEFRFSDGMKVVCVIPELSNGHVVVLGFESEDAREEIEVGVGEVSTREETEVRVRADAREEIEVGVGADAREETEVGVEVSTREETEVRVRAVFRRTGSDTAPWERDNVRVTDDVDVPVTRKGKELVKLGDTEKELKVVSTPNTYTETVDTYNVKVKDLVSAFEKLHENARRKVMRKKRNHQKNRIVDPHMQSIVDKLGSLRQQLETVTTSS